MAEVRVYELARELGLTSHQVLTALGEHGEFVRSASSEVRPVAARHLRERFTATPHARSSTPGAPTHQSPAIGFRAPRPTPPKGIRGVRPGEAVRSSDAAIDAALTEAERLIGAEPGSTPRPVSGETAFLNAEQALGAKPGSTPRTHSQHRRGPQRHSSSPSARTPTRPRPRRGALTTEFTTRWQLHPDAARELSGHWLPAFIAADGELSVLRAYWAAGFGRGHHALVLQCLEAGLRPSDLAIRIHGRRIGEAILGGVPVRLLARQLRDQGQST